jgi:hypothetical protein
VNDGAIFILQDDGRLVEMHELPYNSEDLLQALLADHPKLLAGEQMDRTAPRRWLLVKREAGVPARADGPDHWSMDHLFLDQDAVPTIVEVKRATDTRIRREVVGQMLDYAANAVVYWPAERVRSMFDETCRARMEDPEQILIEFLGTTEPDQTEEYWQGVGRNLLAGRVRMVFVADVVPPELQRIVEFLNSQMKPAEVFAVEIRQYASEEQHLRTLVPRLFGSTAEAQIQKAAGSARRYPWDKASFLRTLQERGQSAVDVAEKVMAWVDAERTWRPSYGSGVNGAFLPYPELPSRRRVAPFGLSTNGNVYVQFGMLKARPPFEQESTRAELQARILKVAGPSFPERLEGYPSFDISALASDVNLEIYFEICRWIEAELREEEARVEVAITDSAKGTADLDDARL